MSWTNDDQKLSQWHKAARTNAINQGILSADKRPDDIYEDDPYMTLFAQFLDAHGSLSQWTTGQQALYDFGEWIGTSAVKPRVEGQYYFAEITKSYGGVKATFGYGAYFDIPKHQSQGAYIYCVSMVNSQFKAFEQNGLAQSTPPQSSEGAAPQQGQASFRSNLLVVEDKGDGVYYKVKGAQYTKFGVRVWPEVLKNAGIEFEELGAGTYPLERDCTVEVVGGRARKVTAIA